METDMRINYCLPWKARFDSNI